MQFCMFAFPIACIIISFLSVTPTTSMNTILELSGFYLKIFLRVELWLPYVVRVENPTLFCAKSILAESKNQNKVMSQ